MKKIFALLAIFMLLIVGQAFAQPTGFGIIASEVDGNPDSHVMEITFPNGTLAIANGVATYTAAAAVESDPIVGAINGIVEADGGGNISAATPGVDYLLPNGSGSALTDIPLDADFGSNGIMERTGAGTYGIATEGTDYLAPTRIDDTKGDGDTTYVWSADKVYDQLALKQDVDAELTGLAALASTGVVVQTAAGTFTNRTITGTANEITITNGDGVAGAPTVSLPSAIDIDGKSLEIDNANDPTVTTVGMMAFDDNDFALVFYDGSVKYQTAQKLHFITNMIWYPDGIQADKDAIPLFPVEAEKFPHGIVIVDCGIKVDQSSSYSFAFEEHETPTGGSVATIETVATSSSTEAEDDGVDNPNIEAGNIIFGNLDTDDVYWVQWWMTFYIVAGN